MVAPDRSSAEAVLKAVRRALSGDEGTLSVNGVEMESNAELENAGTDLQVVVRFQLDDRRYNWQFLLDDYYLTKLLPATTADIVWGNLFEDIDQIRNGRQATAMDDDGTWRLVR